MVSVVYQNMHISIIWMHKLSPYKQIYLLVIMELLLEPLPMHQAHQQFKLAVLVIIRFGFIKMALILTNLLYSKMVLPLPEVYMAQVLEHKAIMGW